MADVASLVLGGGFALAGAYLSPFMQGRQRREERRSDYRALMRSQAEAALVLTGVLRSKAGDDIYQIF